MRFSSAVMNECDLCVLKSTCPIRLLDPSDGVQAADRMSETYMYIALIV